MMAHFVVFFRAHFGDYLEAEGEGMACAAAGDDPPAGNGCTRFELDGSGLEFLFETVETRGGASLYALQLGEYQAGRRTDAGYGASGVVMVLHEFHEGLAGREVTGAGHASREDEDVSFSGAFVADVQKLEATVGAYGNPVRRAHERLFADCDQFAPETCPAQDVVGAEGLYVLEAVRKKNVDSFHTEKISIFAFVNIAKIMEEEKKLYPFRLCPVEDVFAWGKEEWMLADLGWRDTAVRDGWLAGNAFGEIMETYLDRVVGDDVFDWYGRQFPFQVKMLRVNGAMPLAVCPADEDARARYDSLGKEKLWYVQSAAPGASLLLGFRKKVEVAAFFAACTEGNPDSFMNVVPVKAGQYFHIPPGIPHALRGNVTVIEISESSALDFKLCGWGEALPEDESLGISLGLADALDFISYDRFPPENLMGFSLEDRRPEDPANVVRMVHLPQFSCNVIDLEEALKITAGEGGSCVAYVCARGAMSLQFSGNHVNVKEGEVVLVPAECEEFYLVPLEKGALLLEVLVEKREDSDLTFSQ